MKQLAVSTKNIGYFSANKKKHPIQSVSVPLVNLTYRVEGFFPVHWPSFPIASRVLMAAKTNIVNCNSRKKKSNFAKENKKALFIPPHIEKD